MLTKKGDTGEGVGCDVVWVSSRLFAHLRSCFLFPHQCGSALTSGPGMWPVEGGTVRDIASGPVCMLLKRKNYGSIVTTPLFHKASFPAAQAAPGCNSGNFTSSGSVKTRPFCL